MQQHAASFIAHTEASTEIELPSFIKDELDPFLDRGIIGPTVDCGAVACADEQIQFVRD